MKNLIVLVFAILLTGQYTPYQADIAKKYSIMYRDVTVNMKDEVICNGKIALGCTRWFKGGRKVIDISNKTTKQFPFVLNHELGHYNLDTVDENRADNWAMGMINFIKSME